MASFKEDVKSNLKENFRSSMEDNTGIVGQVLRERREKEEKNQQTEREVGAVEQITQAIRFTGSTLTNIEVVFTQISKNFQAINKSFGVVVTLQDDENKTTKEQAATEAIVQKKSGAGAIAPIEDEGPGVLQTLLNLFDPSDLLDRARGKKKPKKPGDGDRKKQQEEEARKKKQEEERKKQQTEREKAKAEQKELEKNKEKTRAKAEAESKAAREKALKEGKSVKDAGQEGAKAAKKVVKKANADAVKKVARKFILAKIGKAVVKTIPIIGTAVGVAFLVDSIWDAIKTNNYTKVGAEAAGLVPIVGGAASAVGGAAAETYMELYGTDYLTDKANGVEGADAAWAECNKIVAEEFEKAVKEALKPRIQEARSKGFNEENDKLVAEFKKQGQKPEAAAPIPVPPKLPPPPPAPAPAPPPAPPPAPSARQAPASTPAAAPPTPVAGAAVAATKPTPKPKTASGGEELLLETLKKYQYEPKAIAMIMAQAAHESGHFKFLEENLNYNASGLKSTFPKYFRDDATASEYARQPEKIAEKVYGGRMGNGPEGSGDGWKYRGRGFIGITGKELYAKASKSLGIDLINNPDLAADPKNAAELVVYFFKSQAKRITDWLDIKNITYVVNGGFIGLEDRKKQFQTYLAQLEGGTLLSGGGKASSGAAVAEQSTQVASEKTDMKRNQQPDINIIKINDTNTKKVAV